jgi:hypothetical protein
VNDDSVVGLVFFTFEIVVLAIVLEENLKPCKKQTATKYFVRSKRK